MNFASSLNLCMENLIKGLMKRPTATTCVGLLLIVVTAAGLTQLVKDTSVEAFIPPDHPALAANQATTELFGLSDPIAVAVFSKEADGVFHPEVLRVVHQLTLALQELPNVREDRVASITTETAIAGEDGAILVDPYFDEESNNSELASQSAARWRAMPPHISTLISADEQGAVIMAELVDPNLAVDTYAKVQALAAAIPDENVEVLVAGPAAVSGYLSAAIDQDARLLQPVVFLVVLAFLYIAFMRSSALLGPIVVLLGSAGGALGLMAWSGVPYFAITNALPVILVAISVADAIHILSAYFERRARQPEEAVPVVVQQAVLSMARPITLTTLTTMAGFFGIAVMSIMPPIAYFAWYAMLGVALAWLFSLFVLPSVLVLVQPKPSKLFRTFTNTAPDKTAQQLAKLSVHAARHPLKVLAGFALVLAVAGVGASNLRIDRSQVDNFSHDEPIRIADERIHNSFAGTAFLDVIVQATDGDLLQQGRMQKIAALQAFLEQQQHVSKTVSIADYLSLLHAAINEIPASAERTLPEDDMATAQYLMVYEASGDPTDFEEEITGDYTSALVRGVLDSHYFSDSKQVVEALQAYLQDEFNEPGLQGVIAGDVNVSYHWMSDLQASHFAGVGLSLLLVLIMAMLVFRSFTVGVIAVIPVSTTVLCVYGVMGYLGINLEPATSMFAAISVGVGVDFAIHLVDRIREVHRNEPDPMQVIEKAVPATARACFFNAAALGTGFAVLMISDLPTLQRFGGLVTVASVASFITALILVPACYTLLAQRAQRALKLKEVGAATTGVLMICLLPGAADAQSPSGLEIAQKVAARAEAPAVTKVIDMQLVNKRGKTRQRQAVVFRHNQDDTRHTSITYLTPKPVRDLTFLGRDFKNAQRTDERWLYVPAARKVRRIPASDRGDFFLGTDFSYEDVQSDLKFELTDYTFEYLGSEEVNGVLTYRVSGTPASDKLAKQLGHGGFTATIDSTNWFPRHIEFVTTRGEPMKTIQVHELENIDGVWSARRIEARNHRTGHTTVFTYADVTHADTLPQDLFVATQLTRGLPEFGE